MVQLQCYHGHRFDVSASPGDLAVERAAFQQVLEELNAGFGDALDIQFEPFGWEDTLASTGRRSQEVINRDSVCSRNRKISVVCRANSEVSRLRLQEEEFHRAREGTSFGPRRAWAAFKVA